MESIEKLRKYADGFVTVQTHDDLMGLIDEIEAEISERYMLLPELRREGGERMSELKPCPFCGGEAQIQHQSRELYGDAVDWYGVYCKKQFCGYVSGQSTEAEAIEAWNSRADDYKQAAEYWQRMYEQSFTEAETLSPTASVHGVKNEGNI